jgi:hypothetical protein
VTKEVNECDRPGPPRPPSNPAPEPGTPAVEALDQAFRQALKQAADDQHNSPVVRDSATELARKLR